MYQRPKRALFISTPWQNHDIKKKEEVCQRPKRALFISTDDYADYINLFYCVSTP